MSNYKKFSSYNKCKSTKFIIPGPTTLADSTIATIYFPGVKSEIVQPKPFPRLFAEMKKESFQSNAGEFSQKNI